MKMSKEEYQAIDRNLSTIENVFLHSIDLIMEGEQTFGSIFYELSREIETTVEELQQAVEKLATAGLVRILSDEAKTVKVTEKGYAFFAAESDLMDELYDRSQAKEVMKQEKKR